MADKADQTSITVPTLVENIAKRMSRREFNSYLCDLYEKNGSEIKADAVVDIGDDGYIELLKSPEGILIAIHHGYQTVDVIPLHTIVRDAVGAYLQANVASDSDVPEVACNVADAVDGLIATLEAA